MRLKQASISAQMDRPSSLNSIRANISAKFPGEADNYSVYDLPKNRDHRIGKPSVAAQAPPKPEGKSAAWYDERAERDRAIRAKLVEVYRNLEFLKRAEKVAACQQDYEVRTCALHGRWVCLPFGCGDRLCPACQRAVAARLFPVVEELIRRMEWPLFGTLTIPNLSYLEAVHLNMIRQSFNRLCHRKSWLKKCQGGIYCIQITRTQNRDGSWNLHLHFVADIEFWESELLSREWFVSLPREWQESIRRASARAKKPFHSIVKLRRVGPKHTKGEYSVEKAAHEMTKYFVNGLGKIVDDASAVAELVGAIKGKRLFGAFGNCHGEDKKIREARLSTCPRACDCPDCLAAGLPSAGMEEVPSLNGGVGRQDAGMEWVGRIPAADVERDADGCLVPKPEVQSRLMVDLMGREVYLAERRIGAPRPPPSVLSLSTNGARLLPWVESRWKSPL